MEAKNFSLEKRLANDLAGKFVNYYLGRNIGYFRF